MGKVKSRRNFAFIRGDLQLLKYVFFIIFIP